MDVGNLLYALMYGGSIVASLSVAALLVQYRENPGAIPLTITAAAVPFWSGPLFVATLATDNYVLSETMSRLTYLGVGLVIMSMFVFALEYSGREHLVTRRSVAALSFEPILLVLLVFTNPGNVFFVDLSPDPSVPSGVGITYGIAFWIHIAYSCLLLVLATLMMLDLLYSSRSMYRGQAAAIFGGVMIPWIANGLLHFGPVAGDVTPAGFILSSSLFTLAVVRYRLVDLTPIARDTVVDSVSGGIVVIDRQERVVDLNPAACQLCSIEDDAVGTAIDTVFGDPELVEQFRAVTEPPDESEAEVASGDRHYEIRASPLDDARDRHVGWVLVIDDITERKERERKLRAQNERLDQFASLVSQDLRNPLNVADGYVDVARQTGDMEYLDEIETSHQRMETIIEDVLTLTREGQDVTDPEPVAFESVAKDAWDHVETGDASVRPRGQGKIRAHSNRLARLLENLYRNSVEHTPGDDGTITVALEATGSNSGRILVEDDGVGIPAELREQIFEHGYTREESGTGLGLSIVQQIAEAHGWTVSVCESEDGGTRFVIENVELVCERNGDHTNGSPSRTPPPSSS
jgi:PAS domain S-box-containing protein